MALLAFCSDILRISRRGINLGSVVFWTVDTVSTIFSSDLRLELIRSNLFMALSNTPSRIAYLFDNITSDNGQVRG